MSRRSRSDNAVHSANVGGGGAGRHRRQTVAAAQIGTPSKTSQPIATTAGWIIDGSIEECGPARSMAAKKQIGDRKSTRLNSSHSQISYAVFCLKKKKKKKNTYNKEHKNKQQQT